MNTATQLAHDSEFTLARHGRPISALEVFNEDVHENDSGRWFADNMNVEIATRPVTTLADWHSTTADLIEQVRNHGEGFDLMFEPVVTYPDQYLTHPLARISGCNPDFSAYFMEKNAAPDFAELDGTRSNGAHVHADLHGGDPYWYARWMDMLIALPFLLHEKPSSRRTLYGKAGCLRVKDYGAEYRTLSNMWINDHAKREFVWEMTHKAAELSRTTDPAQVDDFHEVPQAIDTHDVELAQRCIDRLYIYGVTAL